jgi:hypothetical protein
MIIGLILIGLGVVALTYQGITHNSREKIIDIGPLETSANVKKTIPMSPLFGGLALAGGVLLSL